MTTIRRITRIATVPQPVRDYFNTKYPKVSGFSHEFYKYQSSGETVYGCAVMFEGSIWSLPQGTVENFKFIEA